MIGLLQETQKLRKIAFKKIDESITNQKDNWDEKRETEINKAADETAELIQAINDRREEEIHKITSRINAELDSLLSARDVEILDELRIRIVKFLFYLHYSFSHVRPYFL